MEEKNITGPDASPTPLKETADKAAATTTVNTEEKEETIDDDPVIVSGTSTILTNPMTEG